MENLRKAMQSVRLQIASNTELHNCYGHLVSMDRKTGVCQVEVLLPTGARVCVKVAAKHVKQVTCLKYMTSNYPKGTRVRIHSMKKRKINHSMCSNNEQLNGCYAMVDKVLPDGLQVVATLKNNYRLFFILREKHITKVSEQEYNNALGTIYRKLRQKGALWTLVTRGSEIHLHNMFLLVVTYLDATSTRALVISSLVKQIGGMYAEPTTWADFLQSKSSIHPTMQRMKTLAFPEGKIKLHCRLYHQCRLKWIDQEYKYYQQVLHKVNNPWLMQYGDKNTVNQTKDKKAEFLERTNNGMYALHVALNSMQQNLLTEKEWRVLVRYTPDVNATFMEVYPRYFCKSPLVLLLTRARQAGYQGPFCKTLYFLEHLVKHPSMDKKMLFLAILEPSIKSHDLLQILLDSVTNDLITIFVSNKERKDYNLLHWLVLFRPDVLPQFQNRLSTDKFNRMVQQQTGNGENMLDLLSERWHSSVYNIKSTRETVVKMIVEANPPFVCSNNHAVEAMRGGNIAHLYTHGGWGWDKLKVTFPSTLMTQCNAMGDPPIHVGFLYRWPTDNRRLFMRVLSTSPLDVKNKKGYNILHQCARHNCVGMMKDVVCTYLQKDQTLFKMMMEHKSVDNATPLILAGKHANLRWFQYLKTQPLYSNWHEGKTVEEIRTHYRTMYDNMFVDKVFY